MKELTKSLENYLITIYKIVQENSAARVRDVAEKMQIGAASTSEAVKTLAGRGYINYQPYGLITMTNKGNNVVKEKLVRHKTIEDFLENVLLLNKNYAKDLEFSMPDEVLERFIDYLSFMQKCSCKEPKWVKSFQHYAQEKRLPDKCIDCKEGCCGCNKQ